MVRRLGFDLQPLGPALAVFPTVASRILNETGELPSWTSSLPQSRTVSPGSIRCRTVKVCDLARTPLLRFFAPSTFRARCRGPLAPRHRSAVSRSVAGLPTRFLPPSPFLTTSTVCPAQALQAQPEGHDPLPAMGFATFRVVAAWRVSSSRATTTRTCGRPPSPVALSPSERSPRQQLLSRLRDRCPPAVCRTWRPGRRLAQAPSAVCSAADEPTSGPCSAAESVAVSAAQAPQSQPDTPLGFPFRVLVSASWPGPAGAGPGSGGCGPSEEGLRCRTGGWSLRPSPPCSRRCTVLSSEPQPATLATNKWSSPPFGRC